VFPLASLAPRTATRARLSTGTGSLNVRSVHAQYTGPWLWTLPILDFLSSCPLFTGPGVVQHKVLLSTG
jgi:hypothetical protein